MDVPAGPAMEVEREAPPRMTRTPRRRPWQGSRGNRERSLRCTRTLGADRHRRRAGAELRRLGAARLLVLEFGLIPGEISTVDGVVFAGTAPANLAGVDGHAVGRDHAGFVVTLEGNRGVGGGARRERE